MTQNGKHIANVPDWGHAQLLQLLALPADADEGTVATTLLIHLRQSDFLLPDADDAAVRVRSTGTVDGVAQVSAARVRLTHGRKTRSEVELFARQFFDLSPEQRTQQWDRLYGECSTHPKLRARLLALRPGLDEPQASDKDTCSSVQELAAFLRAAFTARPQKRPQLFSERLAVPAADLQNQAAALRLFRRSHSSLCDLVPEYTEHLPPGGRWLRYLPRAISSASRRRIQLYDPARRLSGSAGRIMMGVAGIGMLLGFLAFVGIATRVSPGETNRLRHDFRPEVPRESSPFGTVVSPALPTDRDAAAGETLPNFNDVDGMDWQSLQQTLRQISGTHDFGDAPAPYPVTIEEDGARHAGSGVGHVRLRLGRHFSTEKDGIHSANADGDRDPDVHLWSTADGIQFLFLAEEQESLLMVTVSGAVPSLFELTPSIRIPQSGGRLDAWVDFNQDGDWNDPGEQIAENRLVHTGLNTVSFSIPHTALRGHTFARVRLSTQGNLKPYGVAVDGEVEDLEVLIPPAESAAGDTSETEEVLTPETTPETTQHSDCTDTGFV